MLRTDIEITTAGKTVSYVEATPEGLARCFASMWGDAQASFFDFLAKEVEGWEVNYAFGEGQWVAMDGKMTVRGRGVLQSMAYCAGTAASHKSSEPA